ncbi:hypothetical protein [Staphylococcus epidermidis]|uniref:hypothetical protein n=1 Tax=Staphylococcus epidermidis TaxID=1282 RepID=UPI0005FB1CFF|nr:hypothetical protein [Staphylococcus epidermidis]
MNTNDNLNNEIKKVDESVIDNFRFLLETVIEKKYTIDDFSSFIKKANKLLEMYEKDDPKYNGEIRALYEELFGIESAVSAEMLSFAFEEGSRI